MQEQHTELKNLVLDRIYLLFESWSSRIAFACRRGCATCCTQDVTLTTLEAESIHDFILQQNRQSWLVEQLEKGLPDQVPACTTNEYATACLDGAEIDPGSGSYDRTCPFLENNLCTIYQVRPFGCRVFASQETCSHGVRASLPEYYLSGATAVSQVIEHLGQGRPWGNMRHILARITPGFDGGVGSPPHRYRTARPLPGFLLDESDYPQVAPLLESLFNAEVSGKKIEDILNGR